MTCDMVRAGNLAASYIRTTATGHGHTAVNGTDRQTHRVSTPTYDEQHIQNDVIGSHSMGLTTGSSADADKPVLRV